MAGLVLRALEGLTGTIERGAGQIAADRYRTGMLGLESAKVEHDIERQKMLDERWEKYEKPLAEVNALEAGAKKQHVEYLQKTPAHITDLMRKYVRDEYDLAHFVGNVLPELEKAAPEFKYDEKSGQLMHQKTGKPFSLWDLKMAEPEIVGIAVAATDPRQRLLDKHEAVQRQLAGLNDKNDPDGSKRKAVQASLAGINGALKKDDTELLQSKMDSLLQLRTKMSRPELLDPHITRTQNEINVARATAAKKSEQAFEMQKLQEEYRLKGSIELMKQLREGKPKVSDFKSVIQTITSFYKDQDDTLTKAFAAARGATNIEDLLAPTATALEALKKKVAEGDQEAQLHLNDLKFAYDKMLETAGLRGEETKQLSAREQQYATIYKKYSQLHPNDPAKARQLARQEFLHLDARAQKKIQAGL